MTKGNQNLMVILSSPSGENNFNKKNSTKNNSFQISVSHTTRSARSNEVDGSITIL